MTNNLIVVFSSLLVFGLCTVYSTRIRELARVKVVAKPRVRRPLPRD